MTEFLDSCYEAIKVQESSIAETLKIVDRSYVSDVLERERVVLIGAGDSYAVAQYGEWAFLSVGVNAVSLSPIDIMHLPLDSNSIVIGITASGRSLSTLDALQKAKSKGASTIVLTDNPDGKAVSESSHQWITRAKVKSYNISPSSPTTTAMAYLLAIATQFDSLIQKDLLRDLKQLSKIGKDMIDWGEKEGIAISKIISLKPSIYIISDGPNYVAAEIGMMKFNEFDIIKGFAAKREEFCHHQILSINDNDLGILVTGRKQDDDEHYLHILNDILKMQTYHLYTQEEFGLITALAQTIPNTIALQFAAHYTVLKYNPNMKSFKMPHANAFKIY